MLDYGSWAPTLSRDEIIDIANAASRPTFRRRFRGRLRSALPDEVNGELSLSIVATDLDAAPSAS